tara:strand:- start:222 stop:662 length:441 start_codon:yes stop_codon:yes gene_type:complete
MILGLFLISMIGVVSAETMIAGKVYNDDHSDTVTGANITITCNTHIKTTTSNSVGDYGVTYLETGIESCNDGDNLSVNAICANADCTGVISGNTIVGENTVGGTIINDVVDTWDLAIVNISVPEFGLLIGVLTALSAVGIFAFVRR